MTTAILKGTLVDEVIFRQIIVEGEYDHSYFKGNKGNGSFSGQRL